MPQVSGLTDDNGYVFSANRCAFIARFQLWGNSRAEVIPFLQR
ncbi:hypothetical protein OKW29_004819 [Paraburkholderia sp. CI3]